MQILKTLINTTGSSSKSYGQRWKHFANKRPPLPHAMPLPHAICTGPPSISFRQPRQTSSVRSAPAQDVSLNSMPASISICVVGLQQQRRRPPSPSEVHLGAARKAMDMAPPAFVLPASNRAAALEVHGAPPPWTCPPGVHLGAAREAMDMAPPGLDLALPPLAAWAAVH